VAQCIYCRTPLTNSEPPEHVIPQGFGKFKRNLTLFCVCEKCNRFFGNTLEWPMRNKSAEGVLRFSYGLGQGQIGNIGTTGIEFKIAESADWLGARVVLKVRANGTSYIDLLPQIGARRNPSEEWTWYLERDINAAFVAKYPKGSEFRIVAGSNDHSRLLNRLIRFCPTFQHGGTLTPPFGTDGRFGIKFMNEFDAVVRRCLAKIAFNYLSLVTSESLVLQSEFDPVRAFIRLGIEPPKGIVYISPRPILAEERLTGEQVTDGHLITMEALPDQGRIEVRLSLFNSLKYRILLSESYHGIWFAKGHHFDIQSRECTELASTHIVQPVVFR
jgi:hypothetical protein